jgi:hypothetical protein
MAATFKSIRLSNEEAAATGWTHKWIVDYAGLVAAGETTAVTLELRATAAARSFIENVDYNVITSFDGGATSELTLKLGYDLASGTDDDDAFVAAASVHADSTPVPTRVSPALVIDASTVDQTFATEESTVLASLRTEVNKLLLRVRRYFNVAWDFEAVFTATGANLSTLTTGEVHIYARIIEYGSAKF